MSELTELLDAVAGGNRQATEQLLTVVYDELKRMAAVRMAKEKPGQTLQPTALVHEAYLRLVKPPPVANAPGSLQQFANRAISLGQGRRPCGGF